MFDRILGHPLPAAIATQATARRLRVLGLHGVEDADALDRQLGDLVKCFRPVGLSEVVAWLDGRAELPDPAIWVTFDDGERSAVVDAAELLSGHGVPATMYVCPAFVTGESLPWWEVVGSAVRNGATVRIGDDTYEDQRAVTALKAVPDMQRREIVAALPVTDEVASTTRTTVADLRRWRALGGDLGNHTWDHPCLDRCSEEEQLRQIDAAARWMDEHHLWDLRSFAYPNGNWAPTADGHLRSTGYRVVSLFDHRLASRAPDRYRLSRLSLEAGATPERTRAVSSGLHSGLFRVRRHVPALLLPKPGAVDSPRRCLGQTPLV